MNQFYQKKIAFITPYYYPTGPYGSERDQRLIKTLSKKYQVTIITSDSMEVRYWRDLLFFKRLKYNLNNVIRLRHSPVKSFFLNILDRLVGIPILCYGPQIDERELYSLLNKNNFDFIYLTPFPHRLILQTINVIKRLKIKPVTIVRPNHHYQFKIFKNKLFQDVYYNVHYIHVFTKKEGQLIKKDFKVKENKIIISPALIEKNKVFSKKELDKAQKEFLNKYKLTKSFIITYIGAKNKYKGLFFLIKAINTLYKTNKNVRLIITGTNTLSWSIFKIFNKTPYLLDLDYISNKQKEIVISLSNIICVPSIVESFGLTYLEAWKYKKPVVAVDSPINKQIIKEKKTGLTVKNNNENSLTEAINRLIKNKKLAKKMGLNGYELFKSLNPSPLLKVFKNN